MIMLVITTIHCDRMYCLGDVMAMQADYTLRRLQQLKERIVSTEGLVAIELDSRRNELVALNLVCLLCACSAVTCC